MDATYKDLDINFTAHPVTGDLLVKKDTAAVLQSIRNLIMIKAGEILWEPDIGGGVARLLFEPNDHLTQMILYDKINMTINRHEPRVELISVDISKFQNNQGIYIKLVFLLLNNPEPITEVIPIRRIR